MHCILIVYSRQVLLITQYVAERSSQESYVYQFVISALTDGALENNVMRFGETWRKKCVNLGGGFTDINIIYV